MSLNNSDNLINKLKIIEESMHLDIIHTAIKRADLMVQELQSSIDDMMANIYNQKKEISTVHYIDTAHESYYRTTYNLQYDIGHEYDFATVDSRKVDTLLANRWSGENYSQRIWNNTQNLASELKENLLLGILTDKTEREMAEELTERFQVSNYKARRLVETESVYVSSMMDIEVLIVLMSNLMKQLLGTMYHPMHPHCRSRTEQVIDEEFDI